MQTALYMHLHGSFIGFAVFHRYHIPKLREITSAVCRLANSAKLMEEEQYYLYGDQSWKNISLTCGKIVQDVPFPRQIQPELGE